MKVNFLKSIPLIVGGSGLHLRAILDNLMKVPQGDAYKERNK